MPISKYYEGNIVQGMDIYDGYAFVCYHSGLCVVYDVITKKQVKKFPLGCRISTNHCGDVNFGIEFPEENIEFPALYVSGDLTTKTCYVENVSLAGSILIQKIVFNLNNTYNGSKVLIDREQKCIYYMQRVGNSIYSLNNTMKVMKFNIPLLKDGVVKDGIRTVTYTDDDILEKSELPVWLPVYQGGTIHNGKIYQMCGAGGKYLPYISMHVFDIEKNRQCLYLDLRDIGIEPEGIAIYENLIYVNFLDCIWTIELFDFQLL
jgi:hypothetical protein